MSAPAVTLARSEYDLQLHAVLLRTMRAVLDADRERRGAEHPAEAALAADLAATEAAIAALPDDAGARPMLGLARRLRWSPHELGFVWTTVGLAVNPRMLVHARALDESAVRGLSASLYARIAGLDAAAARALGLTFVPGVGASRAGLLTAAPGEWVASATPWLVSPELVRHLAGLPGGDPRLTEVARPAIDAELDDAQRAAVERLAAILAVPRPLVVHVEGPPLTGRRTAVALATSQPVLALDLGQLPPTAPALADALIALRREAALRGAVPVVAGVEELVTGGESGRDARVRVLGQHLDGADGPVVLVTSWRGLDSGTRLPTVRVEWHTPDVATRARLWRALAGAGTRAAAGAAGLGDGDPEQLAIRFPIGAGGIERALASARVLAGARPADQPLGLSELTAGVRQNIAESMGEVAERVIVRQTWDDLVLNDDVLAQVKTLVARVRHAHQVYEEWGYRSKMPRGVGVAAMFSGPPGTGKTMVAGLIARELELELYQVDLSKVVSKWVGETEKQLARVFDAAEAGHVLLLFDEADALFGQRTKDVQSATDRYANLEVNFLLQRIESFDGTVILTTNLDTGIDKAVKRRLAAHVVFQHPDDDERARLWRHMLSASAAPLDRDLDVHDLARRFPTMTGANIRNAALGAAFLAAAERRATIDQQIAIQAGRHEYMSMGHVLATTQGL
ncbi:MAG TPA: AAA family ATPase [Kofleriaceae bacterium]|nr:AAA family ATPase [Kofleriaceae bacterium]